MAAFLTSGWTEHARWKPVAHAFRYPVVYLSCNIDAIGLKKFSFGPCAIHNRDLLRIGDLETTRVRERLTKLLFQRNMALMTSDCVFVTTMPRWFGYAFNPVNAYFCFSQDGALKFVVLEVNNTFGESHIYCLDIHNAKKSTRKGFEYEWDVERQFHVSPFNDRSGSYKIFIKAPNFSNEISKIDIRIINYKDINDADSKYFTGSLTCSTRPLAFVSLLSMLVWFPITIFLTSPRILYQAFLLAYFRTLPVFPRPNPLPPNTIYQLPPDTVESIALKLFQSTLTRLSSSAEQNSTMHTLTITIQTTTSSFILPIDRDVHIHLASYDVLVWWMLLSNSNDFAFAITQSDVTISKSDEDVVRDVLKKCHSVLGTSPFLTRWKRWLTHEPVASLKSETLGMGWMTMGYVSIGLFLITVHHVIFNLVTPWKKGREPEPWKKTERWLKEERMKEAVGK